MIKEQIFNILRGNYQLRKVISDELDTRIVNVERWAQRKSVPSWYRDDFIQLIEQELKLTKTEIEC
jgi:hypothetical protein